MYLLADFVKKEGLILLLFLLVSCAVNPQSKGTTSFPDTARRHNPCDPQPPCAPPNSQYFEFQFILDNTLKTTAPPALLVSAKKSDGRNHFVRLSADPTAAIFTATFTNPLQLDEDNDGVFHVFLNTNTGPLKEITIKTKMEKAGCCPQIVIKEIHMDHNLICAPCLSENQPFILK